MCTSGFLRTTIAMLFVVLISTNIRAKDPVTDDYKTRLIEHFEKRGVDIRPYFEDSRFALIEGITGKFKRAVEIKIESFEDYQRVMNYEKKKNDIPAFAKKYAAILEEAEKKYNIPKEIIIGILGVESGFGLHAGRYNPFNAYVSMIAEDHRSKFALAQLEELLIFAEKNELDVLSLKSSYAGAMSYAQFVPWSLNRYFVGNDLYDMGNNIRSVAKFLAHYRDVTGNVERSILRYNPSKMYQKAVLALAEDAKTALN